MKIINYQPRRKVGEPTESSALKIGFVLATMILFLPAFASASARLSMPPNYLITNSGLVGYWTFDGKDTPWTSATAATTLDKSGNSNTGTLTNMRQSTSTVAGQIGQALNFDGVDDYVSYGTNVITGDWTGSAWVYHRSNANYDMIVNHEDASQTDPEAANTVYEISIDANGKVNFFHETGVGTNVTGTPSTGVVPLNSWTHIAVVRNSSALTYSFYINGVLDSSPSYSANPTGGTSGFMAIGSDGGVVSSLFDGLIDDVRIYNRALSADEVGFLYRSGQAKIKSSGTTKINVSPTNILTSGLVGYWTFDGKDTPWTSATAATTLDKSGNSNTGTLTKMLQSTSPAPGKIGQALNFDGTNVVATSDYIRTASTTDTYNLTAFTYSAWIKADDNDDFDSIISRGGAGTAGRKRFLINGGASCTGGTTNGCIEMTIDCNTTSADSFSTNDTVILGRWTHVAVTYTTDVGPRIYADGTETNYLEAPNACVGGEIVDGTPLLIGAWRDATATTGFFDGLIDDVRVYNRALSASEVLQLYNLGR